MAARMVACVSVLVLGLSTGCSGEPAAAPPTTSSAPDPVPANPTGGGSSPAAAALYASYQRAGQKTVKCMETAGFSVRLVEDDDKFYLNASVPTSADPQNHPAQFEKWRGRYEAARAKCQTSSAFDRAEQAYLATRWATGAERGKLWAQFKACITSTGATPPPDGLTEEGVMKFLTDQGDSQEQLISYLDCRDATADLWPSTTRYGDTDNMIISSGTKK